MGAINQEALLRSALVVSPPPKQANSVWASVALIVAGADLDLLFIRRAVHADDPWSGHVALPGGRKDALDPHSEATARRETQEEVGILLQEDEHWGTLRPVQARSRTGVQGLWIMPHVYRIPGPPPAFTLNSNEAETARWIPVLRLLAPETQSHVEMETQVGKTKLPAWVIDDFTIWGLTYFMVRSFLEPLVDIGAKRPV